MIGRLLGNARCVLRCRCDVLAPRPRLIQANASGGRLSGRNAIRSLSIDSRLITRTCPSSRLGLSGRLLPIGRFLSVYPLLVFLPRSTPRLPSLRRVTCILWVNRSV